VWPVGQLDDQEFEMGPVTERLATAYDELVETFY
jgi:branched-subunit amino acid aminotransferase/4-amino-4-deoxychorismate lyase